MRLGVRCHLTMFCSTGKFHKYPIHEDLLTRNGDQHVTKCSSTSLVFGGWWPFRVRHHRMSFFKYSSRIMLKSESRCWPLGGVILSDTYDSLLVGQVSVARHLDRTA